MPTPVKVLIVEDSEADALMLQRELHRQGYDPILQRVNSLKCLHEALVASKWDIIISDYHLRDCNGLDALKVVKASNQDLPFILLSVEPGEDIAVKALRAGAHDVIRKDNLSRLIPAIQREIREAQMRRERRQMSALLSESEARYQSLVENLPLGIFRTTPTSDGNFLMANVSFTVMMGFQSLDELVQQSIDSIFPTSAICESLIEDLLSLGKLTAVEVPLRRFDGSQIWAAVTARVGYDASGEPAHLDFIVEDITARKQSDTLKQALYDISQAVNTSNDLAELLRTIHKIVAGLMPSENFYLALFNENSATISFPYYVNQYTQAPEENPMDLSLTAYVIRTGKALLVNPETSAALIEAGEIEPIVTRMVDWMGVPLRTTDQQTIGALVVQLYDTSYRYTLHDLEVLNFVASQAWMAIDRKRAEDKIEEQSAYLRQVIDTSPNFIFSKDQWGRFSLANQAVAEAYGTTVDELIGKTDADFNPNLDEVSLFRLDDTEVIRTFQEKFIPEERITDSDGNTRWLQTTKRPLIHPGTGDIQVLGVSTDITERKRIEEQLIHNALHDGLTQLPNRALLLDRMKRAIERLHRHPESLFAMLLFDFDRFALINDSLGHEFGDNLLIMASARLEVCIRPTDTLSRIGGDEFAILLEDLESLEQITRIAELLLQEMSLPFLIQGQEIAITTSIGIVISALNYEHPEEVLRDADVALQRAKVLGRGRFAVFSNTMREDVLAQLVLANDLRQALERQELILYFQPIVRTHNGQLHGFEALVYWQHPRRGLVQPADFITYAEEVGLIIPLGDWVLNQACMQMKTWHTLFPHLKHLTISVNISGKQFSQADLGEQVQGALQKSRLAPRNLRLEITETVIMDHSESAIKALNSLRSMGVEIDIDDFGTGYSSLVYLHRLPLSAIKIDRSFISGSLEQNHGIEISKTIVRLATALNMETIAEGVETDAQLQRMRFLGCTYVQGNLLGAAMPVDKVDQYLAQLRDQKAAHITYPDGMII